MILSEQEELDMFNQVILQDIVCQLAHRQRIIVGLISVGYSRAEVATLLGLSRSTVGYCYRQALQKLRELLVQEECDAQMPG